MALSNLGDDVELDDWIENRILFRACQNGLPSGDTYVCTGLPPAILPLTDGIIRREHIHRPVLAFIKNNELWTVLGTKKIVSKHGGRVNSVLLDRVKEIERLNPNEEKQQMQYLRVRSGILSKHVVWAPPGKEFFALWSILNMFPIRSTPNSES